MLLPALPLADATVAAIIAVVFAVTVISSLVKKAAENANNDPLKKRRNFPRAAKRTAIDDRIARRLEQRTARAVPRDVRPQVVQQHRQPPAKQQRVPRQPSPEPARPKHASPAIKSPVTGLPGLLGSIGSITDRAPPTTSEAALKMRRLLRNRESARQAILTAEILQPPVSLRE